MMKSTMNNSPVASYKKLYLKTAREYTDSLRSTLQKLLKNPNDTEAIKQTYISIHSLKSQSFAMGYKDVAVLCNIIEMVFYEVKEHSKHLTAELLHPFIDANEIINKTLMVIEENNDAVNLSEEIAKLKKISGVTI